MSDSAKVKIDASLLAMAFPIGRQEAAQKAAKGIIRSVDPRYWIGQFAAEVEGRTVQIPIRLHLAPPGLLSRNTDDDWLFGRALLTRSTDGYLRQRALRDLLHRPPQPWAAPFIVALIGEYVIEILDDIFEALTPELAGSLGLFVSQNKPLWETTKQRVASYWDAYYRRKWGREDGEAFSRDDYVGFKIIDRIEAAAFR